MILDTCALLWLAGGSKQISASARKKIIEAPVLCVCSISAFEIAKKVADGKLKLGAPAVEWFEDVVEHHGIAVLSLDAATCVTAAQLPAIHKDPFDRFIIAAAMNQRLPVMTEDENFEDYGIEVVRAR